MTDLTVVIKDIEFLTQPRGRVGTRFYVHFSQNGSLLKQTATVKEKTNRTRWDEELVFGGDDKSSLLIHVYRKQVCKKCKLVGALTYTVREIIDKLNNGVFEERLRKNTSAGSGLTNLTIKFAFSARRPSREAADGVRLATEATGTLNSTPLAAVQAFEDTWGAFSQRFELFHKVVISVAAIHPYMAMAWSVISAVYRVLIAQKNRDERVIRLLGAMSNAIDFARDIEPLKEKVKKHQKIIILLLQQVTECSYFITDYSKPNSFWIRTAKHLVSDIDLKITAYEDKLCELKTAFLQDATLQTEATIFRMVDVVQNIAELVTLDHMPYAQARYASGKGCLPGTRVSLLQDIYDFLNDSAEDAPRVCLLTGVAGSGKSSVAHTVAGLYDGQKRLASSYCFSSTDVGKRNPQNLFSTIARDLCDHDPNYKSALWRTVEKNRSLLMSTSPLEQLERLIVEPSRHLDTVGSQLVVVIDALDESGTRDDREDLLDTISRQIAENALPKNLRFLITARPESDILTKLASIPHLVHKEMGKICMKTIDGDIKRVIEHSVDCDSRRELSLYDGEWCHKLVCRSEHLFQWAATACKFIQETGASPCERFDLLLQGEDSAPLRPLYKLYQTILGQLFQSDDTRRSFQRVMAIILVLHEPLSLVSLSALFKSNKDLDMRRIVKPMGSLLDGVVDENEPIRLLHTSFHDFLLDKAHSLTFHVDTVPCHLPLGQALLSCMRNKLQFNICNLEDSRLCNTTVPDLNCQVKEVISPYLSYACRYWMAHLQHADCTPEPLKETTYFFKNFFPYWLEVISLLSHSPLSHSIQSAIEACNSLHIWAKDHELATLASEASKFILVFSPILQASTPHLYLSAMPRTPSCSPLWKLWVDYLQKSDSIISQHTINWPAELYKLQGHRLAVNSVAYSPNGRFIVSGSNDATIMIWDATTGETVRGPLQEHTESVNSVAYSPDGKYIVSGSGDNTIRVWDATTGEIVAGPLQGHTGGVMSVAYSPDGRWIVSGSDDNTIRVWDITSSEIVASLFQGHTGCVNSVAYSPDGNYIVSGSMDATIRVWDATTGETIRGPLHSHTDGVNSVAYSPNGRHIVSGSNTTIQIWDTITSEAVRGPFQGHADNVSSVAYSPDGRYIISGSWDYTIRVWDVASGETVAGPFQEHQSLVECVAYSPDGRYIVSGSWDMTIRVWDATTGESKMAPFQGIAGYVSSVAYSPDGKHIVSGSSDNIIRIWDATSGKTVVGPFQGHTDWITYVVYSPDGRHIVSGSNDNTIRIWDTATGETVAGPFKGHTNHVTSVGYSPDGKHIVSGSWDNTIRIWDTTTGETVMGPFQEHTSSVLSVAYSPDGRYIVSGSQDNTIRVWDVISGKSVASLFEGHTDFVFCVVYSPDGRHIVSGSADNTIRVWDAISGEHVAGPLQGHTSGVFSIAFSPNGKYFVSGSFDKTIRIWNMTTCKTIAGPFQRHADNVNSVAYSPDGRSIVTGSQDGSIKVWKTQAFFSLPHLFINDNWVQSSKIMGSDWVISWNSIVSEIDVDSPLLGESWISCWKE